ncbi:polyamine ABC transporter substrate-binding protein [Pseudomonas sp. GX19020]|uniref:polyamine ABC transporter substrate-binding protein n=1 Tax=Pseudomonas sp. GX19020 TaxID=2942277 RepID=UPI002018CBE5|nr:polyamine ABC transporter substrate-binding protein [Pseudomonas sp. GX19020]MCL4068011.1 polyamine ABC transporter substrate-binding protein [Pseudomonas sp. GX19020]
MTNKLAMSRRNFAKGLGLTGLALAAPTVFTGRALAADTTITVTSWGGTYHEMVKKTFVEPFTAETGIAVQLVDNGDMAKVKAQVLSNSVTWDVIDAPAGFATSGAKEGLWEQLDPALSGMSGLLQAPNEFYMPMYLYSGGILWHDERTPAGAHPVNFADFFDTEKFPGRRCMRSLAQETLEMALIADGVAPKDLYPLDVERAFAKLDQLKPFVSKFAGSTPEQVSSVAQNEADFSYSYYNRVKATQDSGTPLDFSFEQTNNALDFFAIPKGSKNKEAAQRFIEFCLRPEQQKAWALAGFYMPNHTETLSALRASPEGSFLPDLDNGKNAIIDPVWWGDNLTEVQRRYSEWMIS